MKVVVYFALVNELWMLGIDRFKLDSDCRVGFKVEGYKYL
jgi:hypothetical protein